MDPTQAFCRICRTVLDTGYTDETDPTTMYWVHPGGRTFDHEPEATFAEEGNPMSPILICDFCSGPEVWWWRYPCAPFRMRGSNYGSADDWAACDACHRLIEQDEWDEVADRMMERQFPDGSGPAFVRKATRRSILALYGEFRKNRTGPPAR